MPLSPLLLAVAAPPAVPVQHELTETFVSGCLDGAATLSNKSTRIEYSQLPASLRRTYSKPKQAEIYDLNLDSPSYFYVLTYEGEGGNADRVCGVASRNINVRVAEPILVARVNGAQVANPPPRRGSYKFWYWDPSCTFQIMVTEVSRTMRVMQVKWLMPEQTADMVKRFPEACAGQPPE
jgi:hypothetical protein